MVDRAGTRGAGEGAEELALADVERELGRALGGRSRTRIVAAGGVADVAAALALDASAVAEPLGGVPLRMLDIRRLARQRDAQGADAGPLVVDISAVSALGCPAGRLGADVALAGLDQVAGRGHCGMVMCGLGRAALEGRHGCEGLARRLEALPGPDADAADALAQGFATYDRRRREQNDVAQVMASYLRCHPLVAEVRYPGLRSDPSYQAASANLQDGFGPLVDFRLTEEGVAAFEGASAGAAWTSGEPSASDDTASAGAASAGAATSSGQPPATDAGPRGNARDLCGAWVPGGAASRLWPLAASDGATWLRLSCGTADARELVMALEALLRA